MCATMESFKHQSYSTNAPTAPYEVIVAPFPPQPGSSGYEQMVRTVGPRVADNVDQIYLIHGTFVGNDILGWIGQLESAFPQRAEKIREISKRLIDSMAEDTGNFPESYARQLRDWILPFRPDIEIELFHWSGENNHTARCVAAIEILDGMLQKPDRHRNLMLCHSHAGNVLAIVSNLLAAGPEARGHFIEIVSPLFRSAEERAQLQRVVGFLGDEGARTSLQLDIATLGTPIRYQWARHGYRHLLHFVHHVRQAGAPPYLSPLPTTVAALTKPRGDLVQQLGIAGTNLLPYIFDFPLQVTEQKLNRLLQPVSWRQLWDNLKAGMRVAEQGTTLLVEYSNERDLARKLAGHGIYTQQEWLPFHLQQIAAHFY
jgi:hypothetical protein